MTITRYADIVTQSTAKSIRLGVFLLLSLLAARPAGAQCNTNPRAADIFIPTYPATAIAIDVVASASDPGGLPLYVSGLSMPSAGSAATDPDEGFVVFTPAQNTTGATFSFTVQNTAGGTASAHVYLGTDAPVIPPDPPPGEGKVSYQVTCTPFDLNGAGSDCDFLGLPAAQQAPEIRDWFWTFGDGAAQHQNGGASHNYYIDNHAVPTSLAVTYFSGQVYTENKTIDVSAVYKSYDSYWGLVSSTDPPNLVVTLWPRTPNQKYTDSSGMQKDVVYEWLAGDDDPGSMRSCQPWGCNAPTMTYSHSGTFHAVLNRKKQAVDGGDLLATYAKDIVVTNAQPSARFTVAASPCTTCSFNAGFSSTTEPGSTDEWGFDSQKGIVRFEWDYGDGTYQTLSAAGSVPVAQTASHTYTAGGTKIVSLRAYDAFGAASDVFSRNISVPNNPPIAHFEFNCDGLNCTFDPSSSTDDNGISSYTWTINGAVTSTTPGDDPFVPQWTAGKYTVGLTVADAQGATSSFSRMVTVGAAAEAPVRLFALTPCRLFDTRGTASLASGQRTGIPVAGLCGVPPTAREVQVTATILGPNGGGYLQLGTFPASTMPLNAAMAFTQARTPISGNAIVHVDGSGAITAVATIATPDGTTGRTDLVLDVTGYFSNDTLPADAVAARGPFGFQTIAPCRIIDSRQNGGSLLAGMTRDLRVTGATPCGIPSDATAAALNLTMVGPTAAGSAKLNPSDRQSASLTFFSLGTLAGSTLSNGTIVGLGKRPLDDVTLGYTAGAGATSDFLLDASGYFAPNAPWKYFPLPTACREADTRDLSRGDARLYTSARDFQIQGNCGIPRGAKAAALTLTVIGADAAGTLTASASGGPVPGVATMNFAAGDVLSDGAIVPLSVNQQDLTVQSTTGVDLVIDVAGYFAPDTNCAAAPEITSHPVSVTIDNGASVTLSVSATNGALSYQWYQGTAPSTTTPVGMNNRSLTVTPSNAVSYWVRVINACGSTNSATATVTLSGCQVLSITSQPASQNISSGATTTLSVTAGGSGPFSYQWYDSTGGTDTPVGTNSTFTTPALTTTKSYWVKVSSTCSGATVNSATATVSVCATPPPSISAQPASVAISSGASTTLSVTAVNGSLSYQWFQLAAGGDTPVGTNSNSLTVSPTSTTSYRVRVTNECTSTDSATATVTVCQPPTVTSQPASQTINSGSNATLSVAATGSEPLSYQWYQNVSGTNVLIGGAIGNSFTTPALTVTSIYWVKVTSLCNGATTDSAPATITVCQAPVISTQPVGTVTSPGNTASLSVTASGSGPFTYKWYQGASGLIGPVLGTGSSYTTPPLNVTTSYWVQVARACGSGATANSATATVTICQPLGISTQPTSQNVNPGSSATLYVTASGSGPFSYKWYQGSSGDTTHQAGSSDSYTTPPLTTSTSYWVQVTSGCNNATVNSATAVITTIPQIARRQLATITAQSQNRLTMNWTQPTQAGSLLVAAISASNNAPITSYQTFTMPSGWQLANQYAWGNVKTSIFYCPNAPGRTSELLTTDNFYDLVVQLAEYTNVVTTSPLDKTGLDGNASSVGGLVSSGITPTTGHANELLVSAIAVNALTGFTAPTNSFVKLDEHTAGTSLTAAMHERIASQAGAYGHQATAGSTATWVGVVASFIGFDPACGTPPPAITSQPVSTSISSGGSTTFNVAAVNGTLSYQWYRGAAPDVTQPVDVGANSSSYTTPALTSTTSYWVKVTNACGVTYSSTATATVCQVPTITTQPLSQSIVTGSTATLSVTASGGGQFTYQWFLGASGDTSTPVSISSVFTTPALTANASYWVKVTSVCNGASVNSATAVITVTDCAPRIFVTQPATQSIHTGQTATLSTVATGSGLTYQWYSGPDTNTATPAPGASSGTSYTTPALTNMTTYWVKITDQCGNTLWSSPAIVYVCPVIVISAQPQPASISSGSNRVLSVAATGSNLTYQWYQGASGDASHPVGTGSLPSYDTGSLTVTTSFWVRVSDACSFSVNSNTAIVTICQPVSITAQPASQTINSGSTASLTVSATGTGLTYQWYAGASGTTNAPISGATGSTLTTAALTATTSYWVSATNACGATLDSATATITVSCQAPGIGTQPASQTINSGSTAALSVSATGTGLTYQWYVGASGTTNAPISGATGSTFTTPALSATTSYWVKITNACGGTVNSATATITVNACQSAGVTTQPASQTIASGATAVLSVVATGSAPLSYQWYQGPSGTTTTPMSGATGSTFTTSQLTATTSFWVKVTSGCNNTTANSATATITVNTPPPIARRQLAGNSAQSMKTLTTNWTQPTQSGSLLVAVVSASNNSAITDPVMPAGWQLASSSSWDTMKTSLYYYPNAPGGRTSETITTSNYYDLVLQLVEYTGVVTTSPLDKTATASAPSPSGGVVSSGITPVTTHPNEVVVTGMATFAQTNFAAPTSSFVELDDRNIGSDLTAAVHERIVTATGAYGHSATVGGNAPWVGVAATFIGPDVLVCQTPGISTQPASQTINSGSTAALSVTATGSGPFNDQWYQGASGVTSAPISGATGSTYTTPALAATTSYWVKVTSTCAGATVNSATATITVAACQGAGIATQPASQTISAGTGANLSVVASGSGPFTYQWYQGMSGTTTAPISGATGSTYAISALTTTTSYWVKVTSGCNGTTVNSATATITVNGVVQIARRQLGANATSSLNSITTNWSQATQAGSLLVAVVSGSNSGAVAAFNVPSGWQLANSYAWNNVQTSIYYYPNAPGGRTSETVTTTNFPNLVLQLAEYTGVMAASPLDKTGLDGAGAATGGIVTSGTSPATGQSKELVITALTMYASTSFLSPTNSFIKIDEHTIGNNLTTAVHERIVTAAGAYGHSATTGGTGQWVGLVVTFKSADTSASLLQRPAIDQLAELRDDGGGGEPPSGSTGSRHGEEGAAAGVEASHTLSTEVLR